ncbi:MAG: 6-carboxytetrahydropterin synthase [Planctomycetota bacterium]|nr:6-carboxytetrahydropterin synthase [Planctomycetota bacterium]
MYEVTVESGFAARHAIAMADGRMEASHSHPWHVAAAFRGERLDPASGVLVDFLEVKAALDALARELDGTDLNAHEAFRAGAPSAERVAEFLARRLMKAMAGKAALYRLEVSEAPGCRAAFLCDVDAPARRV